MLCSQVENDNSLNEEVNGQVKVMTNNFPNANANMEKKETTYINIDVNQL